MLQAFLFIWTAVRLLQSIRGSKSVQPAPLQPRSGTIEIQDADIRLWQPVSFDNGIGSTALTGDNIIGVAINDPFMGVILVGGSYRLQGSTPPGRYLTDNRVSIAWRNNVRMGDVVFAYVLYNTLFVKESIMSYATGKGDFSDTKHYPNQPVANWPYPPVKYQPVQMVEGALKPAYADTEVIYAIVLGSEEITDAEGAVTGYHVAVLIAEAELEDGDQSFPNADHGSPLFVQDYSGVVGTPTFGDIYDTAAPTSGYTHPLFIITGATSLHYNGTVRPEAV